MTNTEDHPNPKRRAAFIDRDGTVIREVGHLALIDQIELLPGAAEALRMFGETGFVRVIVTNQSAVARGMITIGQLDEIHNELRRRLRTSGADVEAIYSCPHLPEGSVQDYAIECDCRKPKPGLLLRAAQELDIDLGSSIMVGDMLRDVEAGNRAGCTTFLIDPHGQADLSSLPELQRPDFIVPDLLGAANLVRQL